MIVSSTARWPKSSLMALVKSFSCLRIRSRSVSSLALREAQFGFGLALKALRCAANIEDSSDGWVVSMLPALSGLMRTIGLPRYVASLIY